MRRKEAEKLIGKRVEAYTENWGAYVGILEKITNDRPFRGKVRITEVLKIPEFRPVLKEGRVITVGAVNLKKCERPEKSYQESLREAFETQVSHVIETLKWALKIYENPDMYYRKSIIWAGEMLATYYTIGENLLKTARVYNISSEYVEELKSLLKRAGKFLR